MKFSISKNRLLGVLLHLKNAVPSWKTANGSATGYVWRSFIFEAKNDNLVIQATDGEILMKEEMSLLERLGYTLRASGLRVLGSLTDVTQACTGLTTYRSRILQKP